MLSNMPSWVEPLIVALIASSAVYAALRYTSHTTYRYAVLGCAVVVIIYATWWIATPQSAEECILDNMPGTTSDYAAKAIHQACRARY